MAYRLLKITCLGAKLILSVLILTCCLFSYAYPAAHPRIKLTLEEQDWLNRHPGVRIGLNEIPPLVMPGKHGEGYQGFSIDYVNKVETLLGVKFKPVSFTTWAQLIEAAKNREVDVIVTGAITLDRSSFLAFTPPYVHLHNKIITRKNLDSVEYSLSELTGRTVMAVEGGAVYKHIKERYPEISLIGVRDELSALEGVSFGEAHAAVMEVARATYYIEQEKFTNLTIAGDADYDYNICFSSRNDWSELNSILIKALEGISDGERRSITEKWLHHNSKSILYSRKFWVAAAAMLGAASVLLIMVWNIVLRRKIAKSTALIMNEVEQHARAESELRRLNRILTVLSKSHELFMQFTNELSLYEAICKHLVEVGGYMAASVALGDSEHVSTVARYTNGATAASPYGLAEAGSNSDIIMRNWFASERVSVKHHVKRTDKDDSGECISSVAIPLWGSGALIGALEILAAGDGVFDEEEVALLTELAENMAFSVVAIRLKEEHREAEELVRKLSQAVEQSPVTIVITDNSGQIEYVNTCFSKTTGYSAAEVIGGNPRILKSGNQSTGFYKTLWDRITAGFDWHGEFCNKKKNGEIFWESASISPLRNTDGEITHFIAVKEDITSQKKAYEELQNAKSLAEAATTAKSSFLANMSHEIRTPMNAVIGMLYLVQQTELTEKQKDFLAKAEGAAKSLLNIINDILDFSKIEAGRLQMECIPFQLSEVLTKIADIAPVHIGGKKVEFLIAVTPDMPCFLMGDPVRLGQILLNLVSNAIKFTEQGEVLVKISPECISADTVRIRFSVEDSGIGMTREQRERLFGAFSQADASTTRRFGGTGLGLIISKQLTELMGGEIAVESEPDVGSTFSFSAVFMADNDHACSFKEQYSALNGVRILHVCAAGRGSSCTADMLAGFGMEVFSIGFEMAAGLNELSFDLVLYDISVNSGLEPGDFLKAHRFIMPKTVPAVLFSSDHKFTETDFSDSPVAAVIVKPAVPAKLLDSILAALGLKDERISEEKGLIAVNGYFKGRRLLLVEDNQINQEVAKGILDGWGVELHMAANGAIAVQMVLSAGLLYDAVLMDLQMPVMDGFEATRLIRSNSKFKDLPIIAMTASAMTSDRELCFAAGMNDHVAKPVDVGELFSVLHRWFNPGTVPLNEEVIAVCQKDSDREAFPADTPGLNLHLALKRLGRRQILLTVLREFRRLHLHDDRIISDAMENGAILMARRAAHTLKGIARTVGAIDVGEAAAAVEDALTGESLDGLDEMVSCLSEKMAIIRSTLSFIDGLDSHDLIAVGDQDGAEAADPDKIAEVMMELMAELETSDLRACTTCKILKNLLMSDALKNYLERLDAAVDSLDFHEAKAYLETIAEIIDINVKQEDSNER